MFETNIHFRPLHTSTLDIYTVFGPLVCCLKGIWVHSYTGTLAKLAQIWKFQVPCKLKNGAITSWLRLISTSDCFPHPHQTYTKCLSYWYAVSKAYGCTLIPLHWPSWPQIWEFQFPCGCKNGAITSWLRLISTLDCFPHPQQTCKTCLSYWYAVSRAYG